MALWRAVAWSSSDLIIFVWQVSKGSGPIDQSIEQQEGHAIALMDTAKKVHSYLSPFLSIWTLLHGQVKAEEISNRLQKESFMKGRDFPATRVAGNTPDS